MFPSGRHVPAAVAPVQRNTILAIEAEGTLVQLTSIKVSYQGVMAWRAATISARWFVFAGQDAASKKYVIVRLPLRLGMAQGYHWLDDAYEPQRPRYELASLKSARLVTSVSVI